MLLEIARESRNAGVEGALIGCDSALDPASVLSLVGGLGGMGFPAAYKFALLATPGARETAEFAETAGMNRGWRVRAFTDRSLAIAWLQLTD